MDHQHPSPDCHSKIDIYSNGIKNVKVMDVFECCSENGLKNCTVKYCKNDIFNGLWCFGAKGLQVKDEVEVCYPNSRVVIRAVLWAVQLVRSHRAPRPATNGIDTPPPPPPRNAIANGPRGAPLHTSHRAPRQPGTALVVIVGLCPVQPFSQHVFLARFKARKRTL